LSRINGGRRTGIGAAVFYSVLPRTVANGAGKYHQYQPGVFLSPDL